MLLKAHFQLAKIRTQALMLNHPNAEYLTIGDRIFLKRKDQKKYLVLDLIEKSAHHKPRVTSPYE